MLGVFGKARNSQSRLRPGVQRRHAAARWWRSGRVGVAPSRVRKSLMRSPSAGTIHGAFRSWRGFRLRSSHRPAPVHPPPAASAAPGRGSRPQKSARCRKPPAMRVRRRGRKDPRSISACGSIAANSPAMAIRASSGSASICLQPYRRLDTRNEQTMLVSPLPHFHQRLPPPHRGCRDNADGIRGRQSSTVFVELLPARSTRPESVRRTTRIPGVPDISGHSRVSLHPVAKGPLAHFKKQRVTLPQSKCRQVIRTHDSGQARLNTNSAWSIPCKPAPCSHKFKKSAAENDCIAS